MRAMDATDIVIGLREGTRELHMRAERTGIVAELLHGRGGRRAYALLLRNLLPAYEALERSLGRYCSSPIFSEFAWTDLFRAPALERDLEAIAGVRWREVLALLPEGKQYADRVAAAAAGNGERLLAHAYVRYLGDLSGGQVLARLLARSLALRPQELSFYSFPAVADAALFKTDFRRCLGAAGLLVDRTAVIEEAVAVFQLNIELSEAVKAQG